MQPVHTGQSKTVKQHDTVLPSQSVTVTQYVPADKPLKSSVVAPLLHKYVRHWLKQLTVKSIVPLGTLPGVMHVFAVIDGAVNSADWVHPLKSVTVTTYVEHGLKVAKHGAVPIIGVEPFSCH